MHLVAAPAHDAGLSTAGEAEVRRQDQHEAVQRPNATQASASTLAGSRIR
jgi:hypothetical protein